MCGTQAPRNRTHFPLQSPYTLSSRLNLVVTAFIISAIRSKYSVFITHCLAASLIHIDEGHNERTKGTSRPYSVTEICWEDMACCCMRPLLASSYRTNRCKASAPSTIGCWSACHRVALEVQAYERGQQLSLLPIEDRVLLCLLDSTKVVKSQVGVARAVVHRSLYYLGKTSASFIPTHPLSCVVAGTVFIFVLL